MSPGQVAVPPHSIEAERSVLGALLLSGDIGMPVVQLEERLVPDDFYREFHGHVFAAMIALHEEGLSIDHLTVTRRMEQRGNADPSTAAGVDELAGWVPAAGHVRSYARIVKENALRRAVLTTTYEIQAGVFEDAPVRELIDQAEQRMLSIADASVSDLAALTPEDEMERLLAARDGRKVVGLSSGFKDLDDKIAGMQEANLLVLAARPSMGKSALAVNIAENVASEGVPVALFSLEMSRGEILRRLLASRARVGGDELLRGPIPPHHWERVEKALDELAGWPLFVDEGMDVTVVDIRAKARRLARRHPLGLVIVDYVQLMRADAGFMENRNVEVGKITRGLKVLSKELSVPVLAVSQLSRAVEQRKDKKPQLSDLRDSGSVEQDADLVMFLFREGYYDEECAEPDVTELNVAKNRNGPTGAIKLVFLSQYPKFHSHARAEEFQPQDGQATAPAAGPVADSGDQMPF